MFVGVPGTNDWARPGSSYAPISHCPIPGFAGDAANIKFMGKDSKKYVATGG